MRLQKEIDWINPLLMARNIPEKEKFWVLLHSGLDHGFTGGKSILAFRAKEHVQSSDFQELATKLSQDKECFEHAWFGYLGYGLKNALEHLPEDKPSVITMPELWMVRYDIVMVFDHNQKTALLYAESEEDLQYIPGGIDKEDASEVMVGNLASNMTKESYLQKLARIKEAIFSGDIYQANLTRKFYGKLAKSARPVDLFCKLCRVSPAPYSSFLKFDDNYIISSSPERFIQIDSDGMVDTRPIKGSMPRYSDANKDQESKDSLANSEKDKAENLMIVDLSRNDISRGCVPGSVKVENLFDVVSYATVHHMVSTVTGAKQKDVSALELVKGCFPPGSMTGTPKIKAIEICSQLERQARGVYAGAIGYFGGNGEVDLSVVIRTLIIKGDVFEFQVGGAIVADSDPMSEFQETILKAKAIAEILNIPIEALEKL